MPISQKRRGLGDERRLVPEEEVCKLLEARLSEKYNTLRGWKM